MAPVLAAADEEGLDAHLPRLAGEREDVAVAQPLGVDGLRSLDVGERAQPVAVDGGELEILLLRRFGHRLAEPCLDARRLAREEQLRVLDEVGIIFLRDPVDARGRAAADLVEQAGPLAVGEEAVRAAAQKEKLLQGVKRGRNAPGARERAEILPFDAPRAAMLAHLRERMVLAQQDKGEAFVVAEQHVVRRAETLDQLRLEQQRLGLGAGGDDGHRPCLRDHALEALGQLGDLRVIGDAGLQPLGLADVEHVAARVLHAVHAGTRRKGLHDVADRGDAGIEIGFALPAHGIGGRVLVEALLRFGMIGTVGLAHARANVGRRRRLCEGQHVRKRAQHRVTPRPLHAL